MPATSARHWIVLLAVWLMAGWAAAQGLAPVPALTGHVVDTSGTLDASQRASLEGQLAAIEQQHGSQVVVLLVPSTAPEDIAAYANRVGNAWKIGRRDVGDGVLIVVAKNDRRMRIEVAKTLEGAIPDIAAARIIDGAMKPRFREGDYAGGLEDAVRQIGARIAGEALPAPDPADDRSSGGGGHGFDWEDLAVFLFFGVIVLGGLARAVFGNRLGGLLMGGATGAVAFAVTASLLVAGGAALVALLVTWLGRGGGGGGGQGGGGTWIGTGGGGGSSWSSGSSSSGGGGFSSGGGGDFGGGGASGDW